MPDKVKFIGVDVGGSKILIETFDQKLNLIQRKKVKTETRKGQSGFLRQLYGLLDEFRTKELKGIGIAVPGIVDQKKGTLVHAPHLPTNKNLKLQQLLEKRYRVTVHLDNDINAFLAAEYATPGLSRYQNVLAVMEGTGLGGAAIVEGKMLYGKNGFAGEFGHMIIDQQAQLRTLEQKTGGHFQSKKPNACPPNTKKLIRDLGVGLSNLNLIFNPDAIVLGGSVYLNCLSDKKSQLEAIIKKHSLANEAPKLIDASPRTSVAKGAVILLIDKV